MAVKQPFGKKYLLPPVKTQYIERPVMKRVINYHPAPQPQRQFIETQRIVAPPPPAPPAPRQEVQKSHVYHIQYQPGPNQTVRYADDIGKSILTFLRFFILLQSFKQD